MWWGKGKPSIAEDCKIIPGEELIAAQCCFSCAILYLKEEELVRRTRQLRRQFWKLVLEYTQRQREKVRRETKLKKERSWKALGRGLKQQNWKLTIKDN